MVPALASTARRRRCHAHDQEALPAILGAVRELHRCLCAASPQELEWLPRTALPVLLADVKPRLGAEMAEAVKSWAWKIAGSAATVPENLASEAKARAAKSLLAAMRVPRGPFCEAQAECLQQLLAANQEVEAAFNAKEELEACQVTFGEDCVLERGAEGAGKMSVKVWSEAGQDGFPDRDLVINLKLEPVSGAVAEIKAIGGKTTSDELVLNAVYTALMKCSSLRPWQALDLARKSFCFNAEPQSDFRQSPELRKPASSGLLLDASSGSWLDWRPEGAGVQLRLFKLSEVASKATACVKAYFKQHKELELVGSVDVVASEQLAETFAEKLQEIRISAPCFQQRSPGLVFHATPSQDALQSILRRGFLLPGDWIQGTPDFLETENGAGSGIGVYCTPSVDTADRYTVEMEDSQQQRMVLVALAAFGCCWEPHDRDDGTMQKSREDWFQFSWPRSQGQVSGGWRFSGDFWEVDEHGGSKPDEKVLAYEPDVNGLYEGRFHSRRPQGGQRERDEIILGSVQQILPLLLVRYRPRKVVPPTVETVSHPSSNVHVFPSVPKPLHNLQCLALDEGQEADENLWALSVDWEKFRAVKPGTCYGVTGGAHSEAGLAGADERAPSVRVCFLLDAALRTGAFAQQVTSLVQSVVGAVQPAEAAAVWFHSDVCAEACVPFESPERFSVMLEQRAEKATAPRGSEGSGLPSAIVAAADGALRKLARETSRNLARVAEPWHRLSAGDRLVALEGREKGKEALVHEVALDVFEVTALKIGWVLHGKVREEKASRIESQDRGALKAVWEDGSTTVFAPASVSGRGHARDVAAETQFLFIPVSQFGKDAQEEGSLAELADVVGNCRAQMLGSGARCSWEPIVLGGDEVGQQLGVYLKSHLSTGTGASGGSGAWWEPVRACQSPKEMPQLLESLQEDLLSWAADGRRLGVAVALNHSEVVHGQGFVVDPLRPPSWELRVRRPRPELETSSLQRGSCIFFRGPKPPKELTVDGVRHAVLISEVHDSGADVELGFALEKLAQKLRVAAVSSAGLKGSVITSALETSSAAERVAAWARRLKGVVAKLGQLSAAKNGGLAALLALTPTQRVERLRQQRGFVGGLQRTLNVVEDTIRFQEDNLADVKAWVKRVATMRFGRDALRRAAKVAVPPSEALARLRREVAAAPSCASAPPVSVTSGLSAAEHASQAREVLAVADDWPEDMQAALQACGMVGVQIRCIRTEASNVEPWMLIVEYVSSSFADTASAMCALDLQQPLTVGKVHAPDVAVLLPHGSEEACSWFAGTVLQEAYLAILFARSPLCTVPSQRVALPTLVWVKSAEQLLLLLQPPKDGTASAKPGADELELVRPQWMVYSAAARAVRSNTKALASLGQRLASAGDVAQALTEADGGPLSVCAALAAVCFTKAALPLWPEAKGGSLASAPARLRALALALLAEAVSRGCRKLCRSLAAEEGAKSESEVQRSLLWSVLGIEPSSLLPLNDDGAEPKKRMMLEAHSDEFSLQQALKRSALFFSPEGKYFHLGLTNCTPQGVVGSLLIELAVRSSSCSVQEEMADEVATKLWSREISMKSFVEALLPDTNPALVQAALYAQGLRYHNAKDRSAGAVIPLSEPERILRNLAREQRCLDYRKRLQVKLQGLAAGQRKEAKSAARRLQLYEFQAHHALLPKLFSKYEVDRLNMERPADDQLERLPTGLLKYHCCYPKCPMFLKDLRTQKDRDAEAASVKSGGQKPDRRNGLFKHLSPMTWPEATGEEMYVPRLHIVAAAQAGKSADDMFESTVSAKLAKGTSKANGCVLCPQISAALPSMLQELRLVGVARG